MECLCWRQGGIWQQILCWAGRVPAGDSVHRGCFRGVLVILPCCAWEWFWLSPGLCRLIPAGGTRLCSRSPPEAASGVWLQSLLRGKAQSSWAWGVLGVSSWCSFAAALLCSWCSLGWPDLTWTCPGRSSHCWPDSGYQPQFQSFLLFYRRESIWHILSVFWYSGISLLLLPI